MDFEKRLQRAIERGEQTRSERGKADAERELTEDDLRTLHSSLRIDLSEHAEDCLRKLADHFPGFRFETVVGESGWGAKITRDDVDLGRGRPARNLFSRLELLVSPFGAAFILEVVGKGTVRNKEVFDRKHFQMLAQADGDTFREMIDLWVLEYAEKFASAE